MKINILNFIHFPRALEIKPFDASKIKVQLSIEINNGES